MSHIENDKNKENRYEELLEESHINAVVADFNELVLSQGPTTMISMLSKDAKQELRMAFLAEYNHRLIEVSGE
jgi:hypothetical protein